MSEKEKTEDVLKRHLRTIMKASILAYNDVRSLPEVDEFLDLWQSLRCVDPELFDEVLQETGNLKMPFMGGNVRMIPGFVLEKFLSTKTTEICRNETTEEAEEERAYVSLTVRMGTIVKAGVLAFDDCEGLECQKRFRSLMIGLRRAAPDEFRDGLKGLKRLRFRWGENIRYKLIHDDVIKRISKF